MRKLERVIKKFVRDIDPSISVVFSDEPMCSAPLEQKIFMGVDDFLLIENDEQEHKQVLIENGILFDILQPTFYLLHEIGHIKTLKKHFDPSYELLKQSGLELLLLEPMSLLESIRLYKTFPLEKEADKFANEFYLHNYDFVKKFDNEVRALLPSSVFSSVSAYINKKKKVLFGIELDFSIR